VNERKRKIQDVIYEYKIKKENERKRKGTNKRKKHLLQIIL
jgi:hypothetical protein|tara:strand:+ start:103 stop:225 length:123 start_codon:yes stop_codon:yes gene_type:complete